MAKKNSRSSSHSTHKVASHGRGTSLLHAAAEAGHEIAAAVESLGETWDHVEKAQKKGAPATHAAARAGKKAIESVKRAIPGRRSSRS